jgi:hypothetical protein
MTPSRSPDARPRRSALLSLAAALAVAGLLWQGRTQLSEHWARWAGHGGDPAITLQWQRLSPELDAAGLARLLDGLPLQCRPAPDGSVCTASLGAVDGVLAAGLRASWQAHGLQEIEILVPWWVHHQATAMLVQRLGPPGSDEAIAGDGQHPAALTWAAPGGTVLFARAPGWNPLQWSALRWSARAAR